MFLIIAILLLCAWIAHNYLENERKRVNLPGPRPWPIIGNLFDVVERRIHLLNYRFAEKYGKTHSTIVFGQRGLAINDLKLAKELLSLEEFSGRPLFETLLLYEGETRGVVNSTGAIWEILRRFTLRQLRDFGFGKNTMETLIMDEVNELKNMIKKRKGKAVEDVKDMLSLPVINSLWTIVSGKRFNQDDPKLKTLAHGINKVLQAPAEAGGLVFIVPWVRYIIPEYSGYNKMRSSFDRVREFVVATVEERKKTFQSDSCRDFIDAFLKERENTNDPKSPFYGENGEKNLTAVIGDLFTAGTDTTSATLAWAFLYFLTHPEVPKKIQDEIKLVTGNSRQVSLSDRPSMPYLQATIEEVLRKSSLALSGVPHEIIRDVTANGVTYTKGTMVVFNVYYIHHNPRIWGDPENFRPERFLTEGGKNFKKNENSVGFGVGKRQCLGEQLARDSIFLFISNILQTFDIELDASNPKPSLEPKLGFLLNPQEYSIIFKERAE